MYVLISSLCTRAATPRRMYAKKNSDFRRNTWNVDCQPTASYTQIQNMALIFANLNTTQILWILHTLSSLASMLRLFLDATSLLGIARLRIIKLCTDGEHEHLECRLPNSWFIHINSKHCIHVSRTSIQHKFYDFPTILKLSTHADHDSNEIATWMFVFDAASVSRRNVATWHSEASNFQALYRWWTWQKLRSKQVTELAVR